MTYDVMAEITYEDFMKQGKILNEYKNVLVIKEEDLESAIRQQARQDLNGKTIWEVKIISKERIDE